MTDVRSREEHFPHTIEGAVQLVLSRLSEEMRDYLRGFEGDEVELRVKLAAGFVPGMGVRAILGLWGKNPNLLAQLPRGYQHPDSASSFFLVECWRRLRANPSSGVT
jgi:hypothetical protein